MTIIAKPATPGRIRLLSGLFLFLFCCIQINKSDAQVARQLTAGEFNTELRQALLENNDGQVSSFISGNRLFVKPFVDVLIKESISKELKGKLAESKHIASIAEKTAEIFNNAFGEKSLSIAVNYLTIWTKEQKEKKLLADSLYAIGTKLRLGKESTEALQLLQETLNMYRRIGDERGEAEVLGGIGAANFDLNDSQSAMSFYKEALAKREKVDDKQLIGSTLNGLGSVNMIFLNDYQQALQYYDKAEKIRNEIGDLSGLRTTKSYKANAYLEWGDLLTFKGNYTEALDKFNKAFEIRNELNDRSGVGEILSHIGFAFSRAGNYTEAAGKLTEAIKIAQEENDSIVMAGAYNNFGTTLQKAGRIEKALDYYNKALEIYNQYSMPDMALPILNNLGTTLFDMKDYVKAEDYHRKGLMLSREIKERDQEVNFLLNLANDQIMLDSLDTARSNYESAYEIARSFNSPELTWKIFAGMAETYERKGEYDKVIQLNDSALKIIGDMRNNLQSSELKASYLASERYAFEDIINLLETLHEKDSSKGYDTLALRYAEQCKSRVLLDLLVESMAGKDTFQNTRPVSLDEAQTVCPDKNTVILEYMVGDSSSCLWVITKSNYRLYKLPPRKKLQEQIETIRFALLDPRQGISDFFNNAGKSLYEELIRPAEPFLSKKSKLVIIPDGVLNYLPFEVLLTENKEPNEGTSDKNIPFLVKKYPISYGQSISVLRTLISKTMGEKNSGKFRNNLLAFGDPLYEDTSFNLQVKYPRLEFSGREVENIASFFRGGSPVIFLRNNATEENLKRNNELDKFNYIHFAVHGLINEDKPDLSSLVLTSSRNSGEDGLLQATEIFKLKLNPELLVLSACQTGLGKLVRGEGMVGLTRAFMYAGAPSVVVSLWSVSDMSTAALMGEFYKNLIKNNLSRTDALRKAQLTIMSNPKYAHPFYWAPFILVGDWR